MSDKLDASAAAGEDAAAAGEDAADATPSPQRPSPPREPQAITFSDACAPGPRLTLAAAGDVLIHGTLQRQAVRAPDRFRSLWRDIEPLLQAADLSYVNLEGPIAPGIDADLGLAPDPGFVYDDLVYTSYPRFNYHPYLAQDLKLAGVDVVSTANNHALDRGGLGADRTLEHVEAAGLQATGTRRKGAPRVWHTITERAGFRVAWLACTYSTNGLPDRHEQVLFCFEQRQELLDVTRQLAKDPTIDAVIVTPHWGWEGFERPRLEQRRLARELVEAGALAILGAHPHVLQPWERIDTPPGREGLAIYSLGNLVSNMDKPAERAAILLYVGLTRRSSDDEVVLHGVRYVPVYFHKQRERRFVHDTTRGPQNARVRDAHAHAQRLYGAYNALDPEDALEALDLTPQCDPAWQAPSPWHAHNAGLGGACDEDAQCPVAQGARCERGEPDGLCALTCKRTCPTRADGVALMCAQEEGGDEPLGLCRPRCKRDADCRLGYTCQARPRAGRAGRGRVCAPAPAGAPQPALETSD